MLLGGFGSGLPFDLRSALAFPCVRVGLQEPIRIFVCKAGEQNLTSGERKVLAKQDCKLVHRGFPVEGCPYRLGQHIAQRRRRYERLVTTFEGARGQTSGAIHLYGKM